MPFESSPGAVGAPELPAQEHRMPAPSTSQALCATFDPQPAAAAA
jgi:hypothetical protein